MDNFFYSELIVLCSWSCLFVCICEIEIDYLLISMASTLTLCQAISSLSNGSTVISDPDVMSMKKYFPASHMLSMEYLANQRRNCLK